MRQDIRLGKVWGIPVGLNSSWTFIFVLVTIFLARGVIPEAYPELSVLTHWGIATVTSLLFFGSVLFHELAHAFFALRNNLGVNRITLFFLGGVAEMDGEPKSAWAEFIIAIAGPLASLIAAGIFFGVTLFEAQLPYLSTPALYLMRINLLLAAFNMIPAFPLDGGRVLRAIAWWLTDYERANKTAVFTGRWFAYGFMGVGVFQVVMGDIVNGIWLGFIGWFLYNAATAQGRRVDLDTRLDNVTVAELMSRQWSVVSANTPISHLVNDRVLNEDNRFSFVRFDGYGYEDEVYPQGMLTLNDVAKLSPSGWRVTPAHRIMTSWNRLIMIDPDASAREALQKMEEHEVHQLPVMQNNRLVGVLERHNLWRFLKKPSSPPPSLEPAQA